MIKVGITGGIGSGKTTVCKIFETLGIEVYYADIRAKQLMTGHKDVKRRIVDLLGAEAYFKNGRLNRKFISTKIFANKALLQSLNAIVHPAVAQDYAAWVQLHEDCTYTLKEAALLIEAGSYRDLDALILVTADQEVRIQRVMARDNLTRDEVQRRIFNQTDDSHKKQFATHFIDNSGRTSLIQQVLEVHKTLLE